MRSLSTRRLRFQFQFYEADHAVVVGYHEFTIAGRNDIATAGWGQVLGDGLQCPGVAMAQKPRSLLSETACGASACFWSVLPSGGTLPHPNHVLSCFVTVAISSASLQYYERQSRPHIFRPRSARYLGSNRAADGECC